MSDADTFLWAILEALDDDAPRLVFADWLEDQGEPDHAEFIRLQCVLAAQPAEDETWLTRKLREEELWPVLRERWREVIAEVGNVWLRRLDMGTIAASALLSALTAGLFLSYRRRLTASHP